VNAASYDPAVVEREARRLANPIAFRALLGARLPLALFAGLRLRELAADRCTVSVPHGWRTTNPFGSTYFAALAMAAELSTGALALLAVRSSPASVSMLVTEMEARFEKRAVEEVRFTCTAGDEIFAAVAAATGEGSQARVETVGRMPDGEVAARFAFTWSFRARD
jgi:hypothetical protein